MWGYVCEVFLELDLLHIIILHHAHTTELATSHLADIGSVSWLLADVTESGNLASGWSHTTWSSSHLWVLWVLEASISGVTWFLTELAEVFSLHTHTTSELVTTTEHALWLAVGIFRILEASIGSVTWFFTDITEEAGFATTTNVFWSWLESTTTFFIIGILKTSVSSVTIFITDVTVILAWWFVKR
jgi:hypothetical protein